MKNLTIYLLLFLSLFFIACSEDDKKEETSEPITFHHLCEDVFNNTMGEACTYSKENLDQLCGSLSKTRCPDPEAGDYECLYNLNLYNQYFGSFQQIFIPVNLRFA